MNFMYRTLCTTTCGLLTVTAFEFFDRISFTFDKTKEKHTVPSFSKQRTSTMVASVGMVEERPFF